MALSERREVKKIWHEAKNLRVVLNILCLGIASYFGVLKMKNVLTFEHHSALWRCPVTSPAFDQSHQQVSCLPKYAWRVCAALRAPVTMRPLCSSGCQPVCPRVLFPSNLHLTFRLTTFLSPFPRLISFEEIIFKLHQRLNDSDDMTHTTCRSWFWREHVTCCHSCCCVLGTMWAGLCSIN